MWNDAKVKEEKEKLLNELNKMREEYAKKHIDGTRVILPNEKERIEVIIYRPDVIEKELPVLIELHGGAWVAGDAVLMNSFCRKIANETPAVVVNLNYKKLDQQPFPYQQNELAETVSWIVANAKVLSINPERIFVCGQSAGGHICGTGAILMKQRGISIYRQILVYPTTDYMSLTELEDESGLKLLPIQQQKMFFPDYPINSALISPMHAELCLVENVAAATIIVCGQDVLKEMGIAYAKWLEKAGVEVELIEYPEAKHGFLETNREEFGDWPDNSPEQAEMARDCEKLLIKILRDETRLMKLPG